MLNLYPNKGIEFTAEEGIILTRREVCHMITDHKLFQIPANSISRGTAYHLQGKGGALPGISGFEHMDTRKIVYQVLVTLIFGGLAYVTRALNLITPLGDIFVLDLRDFFVAIGAAIGGPIPGLVIGLLAGLPAKIPAIDVAAFSVAGLTVGIFSTYFYRKGIDVAYSAVFMLVGYGVALVMVHYYDLWQFSTGLIARAIICTPINIFILHYILVASPKILAVARYNGTEGEEEK